MKFENEQALKDYLAPMITDAVKRAVSALAPEAPKMGPNAKGPAAVEVVTDELDNLKASVADEMGIDTHRVKLIGEQVYHTKQMNDPRFYKQVSDFLKGQILPERMLTPAMREAHEKAAKAMSVGTNSAGGYLVPTEFRAEVLYEMGNYTQVRQMCRVIPMDSAKLDFPTVTARPTAYAPGENTAITESQPTLGNVPLSANLIGVLVPMSRTLAASKKLDVVALLRDLIAEELSYKEEYYFVNGNGTNQPKGFRDTSYTGVTSVSMDSSSLAWPDLVQLMFSVAQKYRRRGAGAFALSSTALQIVMSLKDSADRPIWTPPQDELPGTILGKPYYELEQIPTTLGSSPNYTTEIWFGQFKHYVIGDLEEFSVEASTEAGDAFAKHQLWVKATEQVDGQLGTEAALAYLTGVI